MNKFIYILSILIALSFQSSFFSPLSASEQVENSHLQKGWEKNLQYLIKTHGLLLNQLMEATYYDKPMSDIHSIKQKLLGNAHDIAIFFGSILGNQASKEFELLFDKHIEIGGEYISASKKHESTVQIAQKALKNGKEIAALFSKWFPSIPANEWRKMLAQHVNIEAEQADAYFNDNMKKGLELKARSLYQLKQIGDLLIQGIKNLKSSALKQTSF